MNQIQKFFDRITFKQAFIFWICFMFAFGIVYFLSTFSENNNVLYKGEKLGLSFNGFLAAQYYSFITALSASQFYEDFLSIGLSRFLAVFETLIGLLLFGVLITKLVSVKQERILDEIYDISFDEKIHRIRSTFYLFRVEVNKILTYFETSFSRKPFSILSTMSSFDIALNDTHQLVCIDDEFTKKIDSIRLELIIISIERSFLKSIILMRKLDSKKIDWKNDPTMQKIRSIIKNTYALYNSLKDRQLNDKIKQRLENIKNSTVELEKYS